MSGSDATYETKIYKSYGGDRLEFKDGGAAVQSIREAYICGSSGNLPVFGHVVVGNSSAAIIRYDLPIPETSNIGSVLHVHQPAFDDAINLSTHWRIVAASSGGNYAIGSATNTICIVYDSTHEVPFSFDIMCVSTNQYKAWLPATTGALLTDLVFSTSGPTT